MNRKFRVWNGVEYIGKIFIGNTVSRLDYQKWEDLVFQQYVGLKDKNGKKIYEGDICHCHVVPNIIGYRKREFEIYWCAESCGFRAKNNIITIQLDKHFYLKDPEIIGNIFENPELLNQ